MSTRKLAHHRKPKPHKRHPRKLEHALALQPLEPQTARVVLVPNASGRPVGCACLVSDHHIITCRHVVEAAIGKRKARIGASLPVTLIGVTGQPTIIVTVTALGSTARDYTFAEDMALLELSNADSASLSVRPIEFATPLVHSGKSFAVMGFPEHRPFGLHANGQLHAADSTGLVQMVGSPTIGVARGFSGSPVWCHELKSFVGIVVAGEDGEGLAWCIPSRIIARFLPSLLVRFRIPPGDRPTINDRRADDPNSVLFGELSSNGARSLTAMLREESDIIACVRYECTTGSPAPRGGFVTFITYPDFQSQQEDAYELFARLDESGRAEQCFKTTEGFTVAAIGDAGDTALTVNLCGLSAPAKSLG